jgi:5-methylthioadenosine/S-adenosylhomocysteine deaminase
MVQEMRMAACMYKEVRMNPRVMPPELAVEMATINGAKGVGLAHRIGAIEVGKEADFVLFDASQPEWQPLYNPVSNLVYSATGSSVKHVFIAGEQVRMHLDARLDASSTALVTIPLDVPEVVR